MASVTAPAVLLEELGDGVMQITMQDREGRNTFSPAFVQGVVSCFEQASRDERCKVVVLTGYDTYFCSGGTREELMKLHRGEATFDELSFYRAPLDCPVPVIAAMQGHGIGGGLAFGLYSDLAVLARESVYSTVFMKYGFTPGMGATLVVPLKLGAPLAHEMMYTARNYRGEELAQRGVALPVVPRKDVLDHARQMASLLAEKPRVSLVILKRHLTAELRARLPGVIEQELQMHEATFHQPEVARRIEALFGQ
jgi:polyketide biosynthesis enoyl-CoA hydratase PksI